MILEYEDAKLANAATIYKKCVTVGGKEKEYNSLL
jgi:hypothetical protein